MTDNKAIITVRKARAMDVVNIARLVQEMLSKAHEAMPKQDESRVIAWVHYLIQNETCLTAELNGRIVGCAGFSSITLPWALEPLMMLDFFYVLPPFRNRNTSNIMMDTCEKIAKKKGLRIYGSILNGAYYELDERINSESGYSKIGLTFIKGIGDGE